MDMKKWIYSVIIISCFSMLLSFYSYPQGKIADQVNFQLFKDADSGEEKNQENKITLVQKWQIAYWATFAVVPVLSVTNTVQKTFLAFRFSYVYGQYYSGDRSIYSNFIRIMPFLFLLHEVAAAGLPFIPYAGPFLYSGYCFTVWLFLSLVIDEVNKIKIGKVTVFKHMQKYRELEIAYKQFVASGLYFVFSGLTLIFAIVSSYLRYRRDQAIRNETKLGFFVNFYWKKSNDIYIPDVLAVNFITQFKF